MDTDKQMEIYNMGLEAGKQHTEPSKKTIEMIFELERRLEEKLEAKVDFSTFSWVLGVLMLIVVGLFGVIYARIENIYEKTNQTNNVVSEIQGKLEPFNFIIQ